MDRQRELEALQGLFEDVRSGQGWALVVRGEAGMGKTALLDHVVDASKLPVIRATGVESEMELAFAGLHQLCSPLLERLGRLPAPQRDALEVAFGVRGGGAPDRFLLGLAVLTLLADAAEERPLLCVVDDAQWLDRASAQVLAFVARRLLAEPVGLIFVARETGEELRGLPELEVQGLPDGDARALLSSVVRFRLDDQVRERVLAEARGNPLALLELPRGVSPTQLAGGFGLLEAQAAPARVEESFRHRLEALPGDTRALMLLAAAEPSGDPALVWRAAERLQIGTSAAVAAEADGLLEIGARVRFRHPLVRSAVYGSAPLPQRQATHLALAEVTDRQLDPDRRAWHLAAAAPGADEAVASELERSAERARARGGVAAAAAFLERAVALTREPERRSARALAAAQAHFQSAAPESALVLLTVAESAPLEELQRGRVELLRGQIAFASDACAEAPTLLLKAARRFEPLDTALARETYLIAWIAAQFAGALAPAGTLHEVARAARSAPQPAGAPSPIDVLLNGFAVSVIEGRAAARSVLRDAARRFAEEEMPVEKGFRFGWVAAVAAILLWDEQTWDRIYARQLQVVREAGVLSLLPIYLNSLGLTAVWRGDFSTASELIAEADAMRNPLRPDMPRYAAVLLAAFRGAEAEASALIDIAADEALAVEQGLEIQRCRWAAAVLFNGLGRYEEALAAARQASDQAPEVFVSAWGLPEVIEAASRTGETRLAVEALERLAEATSAGRTDWGLGILARSRALLADGSAAEESFREAIDRLSRTQLRPELARARLLYGEWLRREGRRTDARAQLRAAHGQFTSIGMEAFAERTRRELLATGETARRRTPEARDELTAQEAQIADLARSGLSNPEIAARLFLSPRTVEYHLRKVFAKLGISSRNQLHGALQDSANIGRPD